MRRSLVTFVPLMLLSGCFSYQEEVWLEKDGSGRAQIDIFIPLASAFPVDSLVEKDRFAEDLGVTLESFTTTTNRHGTRVLAAYRFTGPAEIAKDIHGEKLAPPHSFRWEKRGFRRHFVRNIPPLGLGGGAMGASPMPTGPAAMSGGFPPVAVPGFRFRSTVHFPGKVVEASGATVEGGVAIWDLSLPELLEGQKLVADVRTGPPWGWIVLGAIAVVGLAGAGLAAIVVAGVVIQRRRAAADA